MSTIRDFVTRLLMPTAFRDEALRQCAEVIVRIDANEFGGFSIYPASDAAFRLFGGDEPCGNFGTYADAYRRAANDNCWTVADPAPPPPVNWFSPLCGTREFSQPSARNSQLLP